MFLFPFGRKEERGWKKIILNFSYWSELVSENFLKYSGCFFFVIHLRVNLLVTASRKKKLLYQNINKLKLTRICCGSSNRKIDFIFTSDLGQKRWRSGESTRLPPMWPWFKSLQQRHMWVEFDVGSLLCSEGVISGDSGFSISLTVSLPESLSLWTKSCDVTIQIKALCLYVHMVLFVSQIFRKWNLEIWSKFAFGHIWQ